MKILTNEIPYILNTYEKEKYMVELGNIAFAGKKNSKSKSFKKIRLAQKKFTIARNHSKDYYRIANKRDTLLDQIK